MEFKENTLNIRNKVMYMKRNEFREVILHSKTRELIIELKRFDEAYTIQIRTNKNHKLLALRIDETNLTLLEAMEIMEVVL